MKIKHRGIALVMAIVLTIVYTLIIPVASCSNTQINTIVENSNDKNTSNTDVDTIEKSTTTAATTKFMTTTTTKTTTKKTTTTTQAATTTKKNTTATSTSATTTTQTTKTTEGSLSYVNKDVPKNNTIKSYMSYKAITLKSSRQYKLQHSLAYTGDNGLRMVNGRYCVALGSYYTTTIGQWVDIELENGKVIKGILADCKADKHTDSTNRMHPDGSVIEFVVDMETLNSTVRKMGDVSYVNGWNSKVVNIKVYDKVEKF